MSIKVTIGESKTQSEFPRLMISEGGRIVLMLKYGEGVQLNKAVGESQHYYNGWVMKDFTDFKESLTIQND